VSSITLHPAWFELSHNSFDKTSEEVTAAALITTLKKFQQSTTPNSKQVMESFMTRYFETFLNNEDEKPKSIVLANSNVCSGIAVHKLADDGMPDVPVALISLVNSSAANNHNYALRHWKEHKDFDSLIVSLVLDVSNTPKLVSFQLLSFVSSDTVGVVDMLIRPSELLTSLTLFRSIVDKLLVNNTTEQHMCPIDDMTGKSIEIFAMKQRVVFLEKETLIVYPPTIMVES
jgi:hypothetical protein